MSRLGRQAYFIEVLKLTAKRSQCKRAQNSAILVIDHRIISTGYNGPLSNEENCSSTTCDLSQGCKRSVHAEVNAIFFAAKAGISTAGTCMYCTTSPCANCAKAIVQAGIATVFYLEKYRDGEGLDILYANNILVKQLNAKQA